MATMISQAEATERKVFAGLPAHCPPRTREALGLVTVDVADGLVLAARNDSNMMLNRTLGLGTEQPVRAEVLERVLAVYRQAGIGHFFLHLHEDRLAFDAGELSGRFGLEKARGWMLFQRDMAPPQTVRTDLHVRPAEGGEAMHFGRIVSEGFGLSGAAAPLLAGLADDERWHLYLSFDGDQPAGAGALFVDGENAWLDWAATDPRFRRRGSQRAIMAARLQKALELGCKRAFTETGEEVPGDPQHSYHNILKAGFQELKLRSNYRPGLK